MEKAVVLRDFPDGRTARTGVVDRAVAQAFALKDWIVCRKPGRVATYEITGPGRAALSGLLRGGGRRGWPRRQAPSPTQHRDWDEREVAEAEGPRRMRYNLAESPVALLGRRRDKDGKPFLEAELVEAAEKLREDFELAQMGPRVAQNWDRFLTPGDRGGFRADSGLAEGPRAARDRVAAALRDLGPGLGRHGAALLLLSGGAGDGGKADGLVGALGQDRAADRAATAASGTMTRPMAGPAR